MRRLVWHDRPRFGARHRLVQMRRIHGPRQRVDNGGGMPPHLVLVVLVVERHAHQRQAERILVGRIEIEIVVAVRHHAAARADVHGGLVPFRGRRLPRFAPLGRAARHRPIADRQRRIETRADIVATDKTVRAAVEIPVDVEIVDGDVRAARAHEWVHVAALEEQRRARTRLITVVLGRRHPSESTGS